MCGRQVSFTLPQWTISREEHKRFSAALVLFDVKSAKAAENVYVYQKICDYISCPWPPCRSSKLAGLMKKNYLHILRVGLRGYVIYLFYCKWP